jgi:hypothetical protein
MGSLLPLSISKSGLKFPFKPIFFERKIEKTAAASVDETIAPSNSPSRTEKFVNVVTSSPTVVAVMITPNVDKETPCHKTGLISAHFVPSPPENKIKLKAITPINFAYLGSLK